jgi:hypothetical protein
MYSWVGRSYHTHTAAKTEIPMFPVIPDIFWSCVYCFSCFPVFLFSCVFCTLSSVFTLSSVYLLCILYILYLLCLLYYSVCHLFSNVAAISLILLVLSFQPHNLYSIRTFVYTVYSSLYQYTCISLHTYIPLYTVYPVYRPEALLLRAHSQQHPRFRRRHCVICGWGSQNIAAKRIYISTSIRGNLYLDSKYPASDAAATTLLKNVQYKVLK